MNGIYRFITVVVLQAFALHYRYKTQGNFLHFCIAESAFLCYNVFVKKIRVKPGKIKGFSPVLFWTREKKNKASRKTCFYFLCLCPQGHNSVTSIASTSFDSLLSTSLSEKRTQNEVVLRAN